MKIIQLFGVAGLLLMAGVAYGQHCHLALRGHIYESETHEPLGYATVIVKEINRGVVADENGAYSITDLCEDSVYTVEIRHVECPHETRIVCLKENTVTDFELHHMHELKELVIREKALPPAPVQGAEAVSSEVLAATRGLNIGETLRALPGVSVLNTGATIGKPMIRGLHSNRIAIVNDGVALQSQQWSSDHAPEIDPFSAEKISVVKGAATVRYGAGALGGVVLLQPRDLRQSAGTSGQVSLQGMSNGRGGAFSGYLDWKLKDDSGPTLGFQVTAKQNGNLRAPDYWLGNTGAKELNGALRSEWKSGAMRHRVTYSIFNQTLGVLRAAHIGNTTQLLQAINSERPLNNIDEMSWAIERPRQSVSHHVVKYAVEGRISERWKWSGQYDFQYDYRREYDVVRSAGSAATKPQASFRLWSNTLEAVLEHQPVHHWQGQFGVQAQHQINNVGRGGYIPDYLSSGGSLWAVERWRRYPHPLEWEAGIRADYRHGAIEYSEGTFLPPGYSRRQFVNFTGVSATTGAIVHLGERGHLSIHSGLGWRPPHVYELFARGVHFATSTYEQGNRALRPEWVWNNQAGFEWSEKNREFDARVYHNRFDRYIHLQPMRDTFVLTVRGAFLGYEYVQAPAVLQGFEISGSRRLFQEFWVESAYSIIRGSKKVQAKTGEKQTRDWLPLMPADRFRIGLRWQSNSKNRPFKIRLNGVYTARQSRIPDTTPLPAPPPSAYVLFDADAVQTFRLSDNRTLETGLTLRNATNRRYRDYLNYFRYFADEPGVNVQLRIQFTF